MKKVAVCISGHLRDFHKCWNNIYENVIKPIQEADCQVDYFVSIWNNQGHRSINWSGKADLNKLLECITPTKLKVEHFDRQKYIDKYSMHRKYLEYSHLSNHTTCGDSVSMWYKIYSCFEMMQECNEQYSAIVRLRPDILFDHPIQHDEIIDVLENNVIYIPKWHGKWPEISYTITDYFAIGSYNSMKVYMSTYLTIDDTIVENKYPHTGEGFLASSIRDQSIKRLDNGFSVQRVNHIERVVDK